MSGSYAAARARQFKDGKGMVDRTAYITFLENEIERVASAARQVHSASALMEEIRMQVNTAEAKIANNTRLAKITQTFAEQLEDDAKKYKAVHVAQFHQLDNAVATLAKQQELLLERSETQEDRFAGIQDRMSGMEQRLGAEAGRRVADVDQRVTALEARFARQLEAQKQELTRHFQQQTEKIQDQVETLRATLDDEIRQRDDIIAALREEIEQRVTQLSDEISDSRRLIKHVKEDAISAAEAAAARCEAQITSCLAKVEVVESRLSLSLNSAVDTIRESEARALKDVHLRMDAVQSLHADVEAVRRHVSSLDSDVSRVRESQVAKIQVLEARCSSLESESAELLQRIQDELSVDRRRYEDAVRIREMEMRLAAISEECMTQINTLTKLYSQHQTDIQDSHSRLRRLELGLGEVGGVRPATSPMRERAVSPDASAIKRPTRPLASTLQDLQALVHSMENGANKTPYRNGNTSNGRSTHATSPPRAFSYSRKSADQDNEIEENGVGSPKTRGGGGETSEKRRQRLRQLYSELTALEVEEAKERKKKSGSH